ncbi:MAG: metallophosphoesterase [Saprospiraceae bacterium]|nr:metallophosphoesterase [Saprospiraceae bacterium]
MVNNHNVNILFFADSHLGFDFPVGNRSKRVRRGPDFFRNFRHILDMARHQKVDLVIHGGDLFDRSQVHPKIVNRAYDALFAFAESGIPLVIVPGNHDRSTLPTGLFLQHRNLHIFREPAVFRFHIKGHDINVAGFPFVRNIGREIEHLLRNFQDQIGSEGTSLLLMHQTVEDVVVGPSNYTFRPGPQVIGLSQLVGSFHAYLSGHIHPHQILWTPTSPPRPIFYPGSIERTSFAECKETKGYLILSIDRQEKLQHHFQPLPTRPMYTLQLDIEMVDQKSIIEQITVAPYDENGVLRIRIPSPQIAAQFKIQHIRPHLPAKMIIETQHLWIRRDKVKYS